jgi:hypothetical protein
MRRRQTKYKPWLERERFCEGRFTLSPRDVRALMAFASTDETRSNVNAVHFEARGFAWATNGHAMVVLGGGEREPVSTHLRVPLDRLKRIASASKPLVVDVAARSVECDGLVLTIPEDTSARLPMEDVFSKCLEGAGKRTAAFVWGMDMLLLDRVALIQKAEQERHRGVYFDVHAPADKLSPLLVSFKDWRVIIMPARTEASEVAHQEKQRRDALLEKPLATPAPITAPKSAPVAVKAPRRKKAA